MARRANTRYLWRFGIAMAAYAVLLVAGLAGATAAGGSSWRYVAMLAPLPAIGAVVWAVWSYVREADEMLSRDTVSALAIGFAAGSVVTFTYGLLETVGAPHLSWLWVWPVYAVCWLLGSLIVKVGRR